VTEIYQLAVIIQWGIHILKDQDINVRIILKYILNKKEVDQRFFS
jgi:hypothetical protein